MASKRLLLFTFLLATLSLSTCAKAVDPANIYHYEPQYRQAGCARNVTVMDTAEGTVIIGNGIDLVFIPPTPDEFRMNLVPETAEITYTIEKMPLDNVSGSFYLQVLMNLGHDCLLPAQIPIQGALMTNSDLYRPFPDALGSENVTVAIDQEVGRTGFAGLFFEETAVFNIHPDGVVEVDREGVEATCPDGHSYVSTNVNMEEAGITGIVMVRK